MGRKAIEESRAKTKYNIRYPLLKELFTKLMGGKCILCGAEEKLHFHHVKRSKLKTPSWRNGENRTFSELFASGTIDRLVAESKHVVLMCSACHVQEHKDIRKGCSALGTTWEDMGYV